MHSNKNKASAAGQFWAGVRAELPILLGVIPFALIFGVVAAESGLPPLLAWSTSFLIFAGSAQFLAMPLFAAQAPAAILLLTTFIINLRHVLYSATLAPYAAPLSSRWKVVLAYLLTDEAFAPTVLHYQAAGASDEAAPYRHWFWLGAGLALWINWQISTGLGLLLGRALPEGLGLAFTLTLTFIGMVVPALSSRPMVAAALSAGVVATAAFHLPYKLNLILAAAAGIVVGLWLERRAGWPA